MLLCHALSQLACLRTYTHLVVSSFLLGLVDNFYPMPRTTNSSVRSHDTTITGGFSRGRDGKNVCVPHCPVPQPNSSFRHYRSHLGPSHLSGNGYLVHRMTVPKSIPPIRARQPALQQVTCLEPPHGQSPRRIQLHLDSTI